MSFVSLIVWITLIVFAFWAFQFFLPLAIAAVGLVVVLFLLDKVFGGNAIDQLVDRIVSWIKGGA